MDKFKIGTKAWVLHYENALKYEYKPFLIIGAEGEYRYLLPYNDQVGIYFNIDLFTIGPQQLQQFNIAREFLGKKVFSRNIYDLKYFGAVCWGCENQFDYLKTSTFKCWECEL